MNSLKSRKLLLRELDVRFGALGFSRQSHSFHGDHYDRHIADGRQSIAIEGYKRREYFELGTAFVSIHIETVERLVARFEETSPLIRPEDVTFRPTVGIRLDPSWTFARSWKPTCIKAEQDAIEAAERFVPYVMSHATPFWVRFSTLEQIFDVLSGDLKQAREYSLPDYVTIERAIALAFVLGGTDRARHIADTKIPTLDAKTSSEVRQWTDRAFQELKG